MMVDDDYKTESFVTETVYRRGGLDILVATFFLIAACWLLAAIVYSVLILVLLRMQARGELDFDDEDFGLLLCCNGRFRLHFGCILRRYAIQLANEEQQRNRRRQRREGEADDDSSNTNNNTTDERRIRIMTRGERRCAMERLLTAGSPDKDLKVVLCSTATEIATGDADSDASEGPLCSICLGEYGEFG
jgi:hypothetical protein